MRLGSSPLARGLRPPGGAERGPGRIIPARAGFTSVITLRTGEHADHPRSRGVYSPRRRRSRPQEGSSPLARGLPHPGRGHGPGLGIIPARAGFTSVWTG